jgi:hypothetical protein
MSVLMSQDAACEVVCLPVTLTRFRYLPFLEPRRECGSFMKFFKSPLFRDELIDQRKIARFQGCGQKEYSSNRDHLTIPMIRGVREA